MLVTDSLLAYTLAATLLTLTPGLDTALILRTATAEGGRKALHAALGIDLGCFIWGALVAFGLGALLAVSELAYTLLKWCGAGYLCWLGIQLLLRPRQQFNTHPAESDSTSNWFLRGMLGNVLNPKIVAWILPRSIFIFEFPPLKTQGAAIIRPVTLISTLSADSAGNAVAHAISKTSIFIFI
ncbi:translocator protein, LysE family [Klebsiella pneumoniae]|nr:translocator protein, LysE family [Klebsiella pneumoniae]